MLHTKPSGNPRMFISHCQNLPFPTARIAGVLDPAQGHTSPYMKAFREYISSSAIYELETDCFSSACHLGGVSSIFSKQVAYHANTCYRFLAGADRIALDQHPVCMVQAVLFAMFMMSSFSTWLSWVIKVRKCNMNRSDRAINSRTPKPRSHGDQALVDMFSLSLCDD